MQLLKCSGCWLSLWLYVGRWSWVPLGHCLVSYYISAGFLTTGSCTPSIHTIIHLVSKIKCLSCVIPWILTRVKYSRVELLLSGSSEYKMLTCIETLIFNELIGNRLWAGDYRHLHSIQRLTCIKPSLNVESM